MTRPEKTMDGNQAAAHVAYAYSDLAVIYPITPSSAMAEVTDEWSVEGRKNIFNQTVQVTEMQSEAGAAGAVHGALAAGALASTFTASQGLLLMIPNLYKIAGEQLPGVFHVAARAIASHALSIFGDHSDIYACRQTGVAMLATCSVQEVMDLAPVAHLAAVGGQHPFIHFFDGFRTSHEIQKVRTWQYEDLAQLADTDAVLSFRENALNPNHAKEMGSAQNPDIFFQVREASNKHYQALPKIVEDTMKRINDKIGTDYGLFNYYGAADATHVIIAMGSVCEAAEETVDYLNAQGEKTGLIKVRLYRPFSTAHFIKCIPPTTERISVLDRTKEPGSIGEPLYLDVIAALRGSSFSGIPVLGGRYGLGSKDTTPDQIMAVFRNRDIDSFTIGIEDDVTHLSLPVSEHINTSAPGTICCKFWGLGSDGTVGANKNSIKIIGNHTNKYVQAYFDYDSKKSGGVTISHLRFGNSPIRSSYLISQADFVACHNQSYLTKYNMAEDLKDGGIFLLNTYYKPEELAEHIPAHMKRYIAEHHIRFYIIDGIGIGKEIGLGNKINTLLQAAFFSLADILPKEEAIRLMKEAAENTYRKKGERIVNMNFEAISRGAGGVTEIAVPEEWQNASDGNETSKALPDRTEVTEFVNQIQRAVNAQEGGKLPVSAFLPYLDGSTPSGTAAHERRSIATEIPVWKPENCIQCNRCSYVCPHAVIRPAVLDAKEAADAPAGMRHIPLNGMPEHEFAIVISNTDCTGCGSCASVCPGKLGQKALELCPVQEHEAQQEYFDYAKVLLPKKTVIEKFKETTVKGSQFKKPLLEFSGACAGCGETPYARLITQLYGDRMYIANATGCSSIWGNSSPSTPYTVNHKGQGPAWSNSLFEDAAEFGYGMGLGAQAIRSRLQQKAELLAGETENEALRRAAQDWLATYADGNTNHAATELFITLLSQDSSSLSREILNERDFLSKKSQWVFGGDGWAYDIGFGGLDHVLASRQDINIMVFDTEVYSNTGGQASKSTPTGSIAKFASGGKQVKKKDLGAIAMSYGYVYVAQIAMGADFNQTIRAITEAERYDGPSLIIAYAPCISHGIRTGMGSAQAEEEKAVKSGYWHLYRFDPQRKEQGANPFVLDSKEPSASYQDFINGEVRYSALTKINPERAAELFQRAEDDSKERYDYLTKLAD